MNMEKNRAENHGNHNGLPTLFEGRDLKAAYTQAAEMLSTHIAYRNGSEEIRNLIPDGESQTVTSYIEYCEKEGQQPSTNAFNHEALKAEQDRFTHFWNALSNSLRPKEKEAKSGGTL